MLLLHMDVNSEKAESSDRRKNTAPKMTTMDNVRRNTKIIRGVSTSTPSSLFMGVSS
jgi:hypothetical protein